MTFHKYGSSISLNLYFHLQITEHSLQAVAEFASFLVYFLYLGLS